MNIYPKRLQVIVDFVKAMEPGNSTFRGDPVSVAMLNMVKEADDTKEMLDFDVYHAVNIHFPDMFTGEHVPALDAPIRAAWEAETVTKIASFLGTLPRKYSIRVALPALSATQFEYELSDDIKLICSDDPAIAAQHPPPSIFGLSGATMSNLGGAGPVNRVYLSLVLNGFYVGADTALVGRARSAVKEVIYLMRYAGAVYESWLGSGPASAISVDMLSGRQLRMSLGAGLENMMGQLVFPSAPEAAPRWYGGGIAIPNYGRNVGVQEHIDGHLQLVRYFLGRRREPLFARIAAAMEWSIDSEVSSDQTMGYLAACIGLESLLGDDHQEIITKRLADRYSYLLGQGRDDRSQLYKDFLEVFRVRGELVHARSPRLKGSELAHLAKVRKMLTSVLSTELVQFAEQR